MKSESSIMKLTIKKKKQVCQPLHPFQKGYFDNDTNQKSEIYPGQKDKVTIILQK